MFASVLFVDDDHPFVASHLRGNGVTRVLRRGKRGTNGFAFHLDKSVELKESQHSTRRDEMHAYQILSVVAVVQDTAVLEERAVTVDAIVASFIRKLHC